MASSVTVTSRAEARISRVEPIVRRLLLVPDVTNSNAAAEISANRFFNVSMALSGLRCLLSYVVLPVLAPLLGVAARVGPGIGIPLALVALYFDVLGMRRFWVANHSLRWGISLIYLVVMAMVLGLLAVDLADVL